MIKVARLIHLLLVALWLCCCVPARAQQKQMRSYSVKDGLASNTVYCVLVDRKGYVWFATDAGVSMFDGTTFTNFSTTDGLADNDVFGLFEDSEGRIWFLCFYKQPCFYYRGRIYNAGNYRELQKIQNYNWHMTFTDSGAVWFAGGNKVYRVRKNVVKEFDMARTNMLLTITRIGGEVYALRDSDFLKFDEGRGFVPYGGMHLALKNNEQLLDVAEGRWLVLEHVDAAHTNVYNVRIDPVVRRIYRVLCARFDKEMVNSTVDGKHQLLRTVFMDNTVEERAIISDGLSGGVVYQLQSLVSYGAIDEQGNRWFTLRHEGVGMFPGTPSDEVTMRVATEHRPTYYSIAKVGGELVAGNSDNTLLMIRGGQVQETARENYYNKNCRVLDIKEDAHHKLWLAMDNDVIIYDLKQKRFIPGKVMTSVKDGKYDAANDAMLFASSNGCFVMRCSGPQQAEYINRERTTCIAGSLSDTCWYETLNGLYKYYGNTTVADTALTAQFKSRVTCLEQDGRKRLWVGTSSNGVFVVERGRVVHHYGVADGLTSNICRNLFIDEYDEAWVCTNLGLTHIQPGAERATITRYNDKNCLVDNNVNDVVVVHDTVYAVSSTGVAIFNRQNSRSRYQFPVFISRVRMGDSVIVVQDSTLVLRSRQNTLNISFAGLSYLSNGDIEYAYYIAELNTTPSLTRNHSVTYSSLAPGTYNFYVSATDVFGNKSVRPAHVQFTILPEWYQLLWLRWLAAMVFFALAVFVSVRYAMASEKRKRLQSELNQTISRLELEAIHLQINPHFIFNCLNAIQNAIHKSNTERASYFINRFAKLMRKALMLSKESFITIDEEYSFINNYLEVEQLRHNGGFDYRVEIDPGLDANATYVPAFILQTFIENSINHGIRYLKEEKGEIVLRFVKTDRLEIHLDDNGIGIVASKIINQNSLSQHSSKGLELMQARVDSLNKLYHRNIEIRITDKSELNKEEHGTEVVISLNLS